MPTDCNKGIVSSVEVPIPTDECACIGVKTITWNVNNTVTITLTDNSSITSPVLRGPQGLQGNPGSPGSPGVNGKDVEMRYDGTSGYLQWKIVGASTWNNLYKPFDYTNETWKEIKVTSTDTFADGTPVPSFTAGTGANSGSIVYIRKRYNGDVEINFQTYFNKNVSSMDVFTIPVTPTGYRPSKAGYYHLYCQNSGEVIGSALVNTNGVVRLILPVGQTFTGGFGGGATVNAYISFSTI
jgi:hypothetical protein